MRKEATIKEWKKLYDLAEKYVEMKPWEVLDNEEMVCVSFSEEDRGYFTVMGNGGMEYGFGLYFGDIAFREMQLQIHGHNGDDYMMYMQNCIVMFMDRKEVIPPEQMEVIKKLGRNYGKGRKWIYFENHARGYCPYIPDQQDVINTTRYLEKLIEALPQIEALKPRGMHLMGHGFVHKSEKSEWKTDMIVWNQNELSKLPVVVQNDALKNESAKWKKLNSLWEVDITHMNSMVEDEKYDRPLFPHLLFVLDHSTGMVIYQQMLEPSDDNLAVCRYLSNLMSNHGIPKKILVSGDIMEELLSVLESAVGVPVEIAKKSHINDFKRGLQRDMGRMGPEADGSMLRSIGLKDEEISALMKMAGVKTEEALVELLGEKFRDEYGNDFGGMYLGGPEDDDLPDLDDYYDEGDYELVWQEPKNMRERIKLINEFFEVTEKYYEDDYMDKDGSDDDFDDDLAPGMIDAEWCEDWTKALGQCTKEKLTEMAKKLGVSSGKNKSESAALVSQALLEKPSRVKELLSDEEIALIKRLRQMVSKKESVMSDEFPFSKETLISLAEKGIADIKYGHDFMEIYLTVRIPKQLKGQRL